MKTNKAFEDKKRMTRALGRKRQASTSGILQIVVFCDFFQYRDVILLFGRQMVSSGLTAKLLSIHCILKLCCTV